MKYIIELEDEPNESYFGEGNFYRCKQIPYWSISESMRNRLEPYGEADRKTEPQRGCDADCNEDCIECVKETELWKAEQTEPQTTDYCDVCNHKGCDNCVADWSNPYCVPSNYEPKDEPQYDIDKGTIKCDNCSESGSYKCSKCDGEMYFKRLEVEDEPQTERSSE